MPRKRSVTEAIQQAVEASDADTAKHLPHLGLKKIDLFPETILKIKWRGDMDEFRELTIDYQIPSPAEEKDLIHCTLTKGEKPHPDFFLALNQFMPLVINVLYLDGDNWKDGWVSGITLKPDGVVITAQMTIENSRAVVNTPFIKTDDVDDFKLRSLIHQAQFYIHGKRAQLSLLDSVEEAAA